jgi:prepilin-type N-terminal cleavage/methylation domain-containing protein/prepilin-type processing-associated H-X9-DG protein
MSWVKTSLSFTLLELLVCISIIAVLAALIVPSVSSAKESAFKAKCASNLRQVGMAIEYYKEDNDQYYPFKPPTTMTYWMKDDLMNMLGSNYLQQNWSVFSCPSTRNRYDIANRTNSAGGRMDYEINSGIFGMNRFGTNGYWHGAPYNRCESITIPTIAVVIYDWPGPNYYPPMNGSPDPLAYPMPHPSGGINAYYVDGHVAWISLEEADEWKQGQYPFYKWGRDP